MTRIVNLTGHRLVLGTVDDQVGYPSRGRVRLDTQYLTIDHVTLQNDAGLDTGVEIPLLELANGETTSVPMPVRNTLYVVSGLVAGRVRRPDVVAPVRLHRDGGRVEYARALLRYGRTE